MTDILDSLIALKSARDITSPLLSPLSMKVLIPLLRKAVYKWLVKVVRVSSPLKFRNTSYLYEMGIEEDGEEPAAASVLQAILFT
ncbi:hypothetical protein RchiOBHm_Chr5g0039661 [Rosa chinensis]|uniref:Uncharacterized protein n=1 Tax=Rosa chinensis TaxID=74649 RepID=A0A2P6QCC5_ROSCH|nr:hypothetical protein RchiOBHm_Chr5g0039661 [Rosa chinensis]